MPPSSSMAGSRGAVAGCGSPRRCVLVSSARRSCLFGSYLRRNGLALALREIRVSSARSKCWTGCSYRTSGDKPSRNSTRADPGTRSRGPSVVTGSVNSSRGECSRSRPSVGILFDGAPLPIGFSDICGQLVPTHRDGNRSIQVLAGSLCFDQGGP